ncbi:MAG: DUF4290 domain-containing protein [Flavobacteriaceae bacterium]
METLQYNTDRERLIIPEYGRHIHLMIQQVVDEKDREKRNKQAQAIIGVMGNLNPHLRDVPDFQHKLWDQLHIMANFALDVDSPYEVPQKEILDARPERLEYPNTHLKYRFYGINILRMIEVAKSWEAGELKDALVFTIANHMKKCFLNWNKDTVEDSVIFAHLDELSDGALKVAEELLPLTDAQELLKLKTKNGNGPKSNTKQRNRKRKRF